MCAMRCALASSISIGGSSRLISASFFADGSVLLFRKHIHK